jgi:F420H2 dehydrogenase subunit N
VSAHVDPFAGWQAIEPEILLAAFAILVPLMALPGRRRKDGTRVPGMDRAGIRQFTLLGLLFALLFTLGGLLWPRGYVYTIPFVNVPFQLDYVGTTIGTLSVTYASQLFKLVFLAIAFLVVLGMGRPLRGKADEDWGEFCSLILFATLGMMVVASANELITLVLGIETASMASYILAGFRRDRAGAEAGLKYFTIGAISSGLLVFAVSLLYGIAGTTSIPELATRISSGPFDAILLIPIVMFLAGLGFKISSVPFHAWAPDVYSGAPPAVVGLLASGSKAMGFVAAFNVFVVGLGGIKPSWQMAVAAVAAASILFGNLVALQQNSVRRMLAYSSIAQAGYVLIAVVVGTSGADAAAGDEPGTWAVGGGIFHLLTNAAMKLGAFLIVGALLWAGLPDTVDGWKGLGRRAPLFAFCMTLFLLSMAGLPPLGGFASKFVLFSAAIDAGANAGLGWMVWLAAVAIAGSAVSLFYYLRLIRAMVVEPGEPGRLDAPNGTIAAVVICAALIVLMGIWPGPFMDASFRAAEDLLRMGQPLAPLQP